MQPNDDNLPENGMPGAVPVAPPASSQPSVEQPAEPIIEESSPVMEQPMTPPAADVTPPAQPQPDLQPAPAPSEQPVSFQPAAEGEQPQPIQSVSVESEKPHGFFGKIKSMFSKK